MSEIYPPSIEKTSLTEKIERSPEDIQDGQERIKKEFETYKTLHESHFQKEQEEREGLDDAMDIALEDLKKDLYEILGANKGGDKLERFKAGMVDGIIEKGEMANELKKDPVGFVKKIKEGINHIFKSVENFTNFVKSMGKSIVEMFTNAYEMGKGAIDFVIGAALGGAGAIGFKGAKRLAKLRKLKKGAKTTEKASIVVATGSVVANEGVSVLGGKLAKETAEKVLTRTEKLAIRPSGIEIKRWEVLVKSYPKYSPEQLKKVFDVENFLSENGIDREFFRETILSAEIDTVQIIKSSTKDINVYRFYGEGASQYSYYYTPKDLRFIPEHEIRDFLALPDGNAIERVTQGVIPKGSPMLKGKIAPQITDEITFFTDKLGGSTQIYYPLKDKNVTILKDYNLKNLQNGDYE